MKYLLTVAFALSAVTAWGETPLFQIDLDRTGASGTEQTVDEIEIEVYLGYKVLDDPFARPEPLGEPLFQFTLEPTSEPLLLVADSGDAFDQAVQTLSQGWMQFGLTVDGLGTPSGGPSLQRGANPGIADPGQIQRIEFQIHEPEPFSVVQQDVAGNYLVSFNIHGTVSVIGVPEPEFTGGSVAILLALFGGCRFKRKRA